MASSNASARAQQRAEEAVVETAMGKWQDLCQAEKLDAVRELLRTELQLAKMVCAVRGLTAEKQRLGAENEALQDTLKKATGESVGHAQQVQLLSVQLTECNKRIKEYKQQAASDEAGVDPPDDAPAENMSLAYALQLNPESASQAELMEGFSVVQQSHLVLEAPLRQKALQSFGQPKQPQQAQQAGALQDIQEDQCMTLEQAIKLVDYNLYSGDDVRAALKILQDEYGKLQDSEANLTALQEENKRLIRKCQELSGTVTLWETRYAAHLDAELVKLDDLRAKQHAENIEKITSDHQKTLQRVELEKKAHELACKTSKKEIEILQKEVRSLNHLAGKAEDLKTANKKLKSLENELKQSRQDQVSLQDKLDTAKQQLGVATQEIDRARKQSDKECLELGEVIAGWDGVKAELNTTKLQLETTKLQLETTKQELATVRSQCRNTVMIMQQELRTYCNGLKARHEAFDEALDYCIQQRQVLHSKIDVTEAELSASREELNACHAMRAKEFELGNEKTVCIEVQLERLERVQQELTQCQQALRSTQQAHWHALTRHSALYTVIQHQAQLEQCHTNTQFAVLSQEMYGQEMHAPDASQAPYDAPP